MIMGHLLFLSMQVMGHWFFISQISMGHPYFSNKFQNLHRSPLLDKYCTVPYTNIMLWRFIPTLCCDDLCQHYAVMIYTNIMLWQFIPR